MGLWGGRFEEGPDALFRAFNDSLPFDHRLVHADIQGSVAWAGAIHEAGVLSAAEHAALVGALNDLKEEVGDDTASIAQDADEDVHAWVERRLIEMLGDVGKKLHTGRSRNDQVATDLRLYISHELTARIGEIRAAQLALLDLAEREMDCVLPGYTHLQRAQPVLLAHWCLAYVEMLERDLTRFDRACRSARAACPLGCAALAGTTFPVDREKLARELGFEAPARNSLDAVSDRDFVLETLHAASICALHLTRMAEDLILYNSGEFGFVTLGDRVTSGSSLMPQKKNPDALELIRGKCGRILGAATSLSIMLKGLPLAYNKDLQEDKEPVFDALGQISMCLRVTGLVVESIEVDQARMLEAAKGGHANATELADYLVEKGIPFRAAHEICGRVVRLALERGCGLEELPVEELQSFDGRIAPDVYDRLTIDSLLERRDVIGGTSREQVSAALVEARARLGAASSP